MLHFLAVFIFIQTSLALLPLDRILFIDNENYTLIYQLKMLNMMQIDIRHGAEGQSVHKDTSGIKVVISDSGAYFTVYLILSRTWIFYTVFSLHSVLQRYLIPMNILLEFIEINRVILFELKVLIKICMLMKSARIGVLIIQDIYLLILYYYQIYYIKSVALFVLINIVAWITEYSLIAKHYKKLLEVSRMFFSVITYLFCSDFFLCSVFFFLLLCARNLISLCF